ARQLQAQAATNAQPTFDLKGFEQFEQQSQLILGLGFRLADAHRESLDSFLADSKKSLNYLRFVSLGSLALLLLAVGGLARVVYCDLIAPLIVKLVESNELSAPPY